MSLASPDPIAERKQGRWAYLLADSEGAIRTIANPSYFHEAGELLKQLTGDVTFYTGRSGEIHAFTDLFITGIERLAGNERLYPRYLDTYNWSDVSVRGRTLLQTAPGASTFVPGVTIGVSEPQPTIEPRDVVSEPRPAFTQVIGGPAPAEPAPASAPGAPSIEGPGARPLPAFQAPRPIEAPATLAAIAKAPIKASADPRKFVAPIPPIPSPDPVSIVINIGLVLAGLFSGLFGGSDKETKRSIEKLRDAFVENAKQQTQFTWRTAFGLGWLLIAVGKLWVRVLRPLLDTVKGIIDDIRRIYDRVLRPIFQTIEKVRKIILDLYERFVRPVIIAIQRLRKALYVLRLLGFKFAERLDRRLAEIESRITGPLLEVLRQVNTLGGWLNVILTGRGLLQEPTLINSLAKYAGDWITLFYAGHGSALDVLSRSQLYERPRPQTLPEARAEARQAVIVRSGAIADQIQAEARRARGEIGG